MNTSTSNYRLQSVLLNKCPRCGQGDFFVTKTAYARNFDKMHRYCQHCGEDLVPEPGFYQGALYMSYALYVLVLLVYFFAYTYFSEGQYDYFLITIVPLFVLMTPLAYRLARRSWLAIFIRPRKA